MIPVIITSDLSEFPVDRKYDRETKISDLKAKLELITGANHKTMSIDLYINGKFVTNLDQDDQNLGHYLADLATGGDDLGVKLHVKDDSTSKDEFNDVSKVEKYTLPEEKYEQRTDSVRNFLKELKAKKAGEDKDVTPHESN